MKKIHFLLFASFLAACGAPKTAATIETTQSDRVEVLSFHSKQRCATCIAIERLTREVIETEFAEPLRDGRLLLREINLAQPENGPIADRYEVTWSALFVNKWQAGEEHVNNLTQFAFASARSNPEKFKAGLKAEIEKLLAE